MTLDNLTDNLDAVGMELLLKSLIYFNPSQESLGEGWMKMSDTGRGGWMDADVIRNITKVPRELKDLSNKNEKIMLILFNTIKILHKRIIILERKIQ